MRWKAFAIVGLVTCSAGCNIAYLTTHNLVHEFKQSIAEVDLRHELREEAEALAGVHCSRLHRKKPSGAFADGFADGYVQQSLYDGTTLPPGVPPSRYRRKSGDFTPAGQAAQRDYLDGFQAGAETALALGRREALLVTVALPVPRPEPQLSIHCVPAPAGVNLRSDPVLPPPNALPPAVIPEAFPEAAPGAGLGTRSPLFRDPPGPGARVRLPLLSVERAAARPAAPNPPAELPAPVRPAGRSRDPRPEVLAAPVGPGHALPLPPLPPPRPPADPVDPTWGPTFR